VGHALNIADRLINSPAHAGGTDFTAHDPMSMSETWHKDDYSISTDRARLNIELIHNFLSNTAYWATGRSREVVATSIENSLPFGIYKGAEQVDSRAS